jgi:group I intron endonuclease
MESGIYKITSPSNRVYIGQSVNINNRFKSYRKYNHPSQIKLYRSIEKYGFESHIFEIIEYCDIDLLNKRERYWQDYYNVISEGLNCVLTNTSDKRKEFSISVSISQAKTRNVDLEDCLNIWNLYTGGFNTAKVKKIFPQFNYKLLWMIKSGTHWINEYLRTEYNINYSDYVNKIPYDAFSKEQEEHIKDLYYNQDMTLPKIAKLLEANDRTISKILQIKKKKLSIKPSPIIQYSKDMNIISHYNSATEAAEKLGLSRRNITSACNGNSKTYKGFIWRYNK